MEAGFSEQHVNRSAPAVARPGRGEREYMAGQAAATEPQFDLLLQDSSAVGRVQSASVDEEKTAVSGSNRFVKQGEDGFVGFFHGEPVQIQVSLHRVVPVMKPPSQAWVNAGSDSFHVLRRVFERKLPFPGHQIRECCDDL